MAAPGMTTQFDNTLYSVRVDERDLSEVYHVAEKRVSAQFYVACVLTEATCALHDMAKTLDDLATIIRERRR